MNHSIFEILTGHFASGVPIGAPFAAADLLASIEDHLARLFNARQESVSHLEGYGMPNLGEIFFNLPYSANRLQTAVQENIDLFEPRLINVRVSYLKEKKDPANRLHFEIRGQTVAGMPLVGVATFVNGGKAEVALKEQRTAYA
ncbi:MAG: type VI secretion system baseplate subunit TssE [Thermodesulfobacteriota bacterium]